MLHSYGVAVTEIARSEGITASRVWDILKDARVEAASEQVPDASATSAEERQPRPPRRLSRRTAQSRAWEYAEQHIISALGLAVDGFWVRIIVAIHEEGDGYRLRIGEDSRFRTREDLADLFGRREVDIHESLAKLFGRNRLIDLDGGDIGIPLGIGLTPGENARGKLVTARMPVRQNVPDPRQPHMMHVLPGGRSDSREMPASTQAKTPISLESDSREIRDFPGVDSRDINSKRSLQADNLTAELVELARLGRAANADDLGAVQAWTAIGDTPDQMREAIKNKRGQLGEKAISSLTYFNGAMRDAREARQRAAAAPDLAKPSAAPAAAPAQVSPEDQALIDRLRAIKHPNSPLLASFQTEATAELAYRWLDAGEAWVRLGRRSDLKPPDFALASMARSIFEEDMLAVEEALTDPDPPEAAD